MDPVTVGLASIQLLGGISGMLGASAARKRAIRAREIALQEMMRDMAEQERIIQDRNALSLLGQAGYLRDALNAQGGALGSAMAQAGVYNSSAVAGALQKQARDNATILAELQAKLASQLAEIQAKNKQFIAQQKLGFATQDYATAREDEAATLDSIIKGLTALGSMYQQQQNAKRNITTTSAKKVTPSTTPGTNVDQNSGFLSEYLRRRFGIQSSQSYGLAGNGNYNATIPPLNAPRTFMFGLRGLY